VNLLEILIQETENSLKLQHSNGAFEPGHNGPYFDCETPVRNTSHWLFTLCSLYERTGKTKYLESSTRAAEYLASRYARPMKASFWIRKNPQKDFCNGLIGQAWAIEALVLASKVLEEPRYYKIAEEVFLLHPWDEKKKSGIE